jgi:PAS domain S-box-containing protein
MTAPKKSLSIRQILLLITGTLALMIALLVATDMVGSINRLAMLRSLASASVLSDQLFDATERLSVERDVALSLFDAPDVDTAEGLQSRLVESRKAANDALATAVPALDRYAFPELADLRGKIKTRMAVIRDLRGQIDKTMLLPPEKRDRALAARWSNEVTALIDETQNLWIGFIQHFTGVDAVATEQLWFKHFTRTITDYTGRQRSLIGRLIAQNADPSSAQTSQLLRDQGVIDESWDMARILAQQSGIWQPIAPYYNDARSQYSTMHDMVQNIFYTPGARHAGLYPIGADLWFELSTQASDSLGNLKDATLTQTRKYLDGRIADAQRQIDIQAVTLIIAVLLCLYSFWIVVVRVIRPINVMVDALGKTMRGEHVESVPPAARRDEIGKLARVLHAFQRTMEEVRRTANELDQSRSRLRAVVDNARDGLIAVDEQGTITNFNPACERIFGHAASSMIGRKADILFASDDDDARVAFDGGAEREIHARREDGTIFPAELSISEYAIEGFRYFLAIVRDITARKEADQALQRHTEALERSNKELDDFAYIASHDLKEPLRGIHNHSRFLLEDNAGKLDEDSAKRLNRLVYLSQRMERLVNDLLYFSRLGRQELAIQPTDIGAVIRDIEATLEIFLEERSAKIVMPRPLPTFTCDKPRVTELFRNLITNAIKYNDKTVKTVEIGFLENARTQSGVLLQNVFYVKDDGRGIDPEFHTEIFRIFKRLQSSQGAEEGTGVGLTFVKKIVERHGGQIWLDSAPGKGTTFYFTLEASQHDAAIDPQVAA